VIEEILEFWFGELDEGLCAAERRQALFRADPDFDAEIRRRFGSEVEAALAGERNAWGDTARGRVALVLLLDQFTRNLFRGSARAFAGDAAALANARRAVAHGQDLELPLEPRVFLYVPYEHAEDLTAQDEGVDLLARLLATLAPGSPAADVVASYLGHAREHRALVAAFGRFPHRNAVLGRASTEAERAHLARDGRSFGQG
jgi:uncharacterized protein (DUF924 family)